MDSRANKRADYEIKPIKAMTSKEKAMQLILKTSKQCALIFVDDIIYNIVNTNVDYGASWTYWSQVKTEIENYEPLT